MNLITKTALVVLNLVIVLGFVNGAILKKQAVVESGRSIFLDLAPVDPRSLMQGDYMILNFALNRDSVFKDAAANGSTRGTAVLKVDEAGKATFARIFENGGNLAENEVLLGYRKWRRGFKFGIESFFFEEGSGEKYAEAKVAEVRVSDTGEPVLIDLHEKIPE